MFGLITAINVEDIPKILRTVARNYRKTETRRYAEIWTIAADMLDDCANTLDIKIAEAKEREPKPPRIVKRNFF